jgi:hypothetical protein
MSVCIRKNGTLGLISYTAISDIYCIAHARAIAESVARHAVSDNAAQVFIVVYTNGKAESFTAQLRNTTRIIAGQMTLKEIETEVWLVNETGYRHLECYDCCPAEGHSLIKLQSTAVRAALVYQGYSVAESRSSYLALGRADSEGRQLAAVGAQRFEVKKHNNDPNWRVAALTGWLFACELARRRQHIPPKLLGMLGAALANPVVRDAILIALIPGGLSTAAALLEGQPTAIASARSLLELVVDSEEALAPAVEHCRTATTVLGAIAAHIGTEYAAAPLTLLAFIAWWLGDGTRSNRRLADVRIVDPEYPLALTLATVNQTHVRPGWLQARAHATAA